MAADKDQNLSDEGGSTLQSTLDAKFEVAFLYKNSLVYSYDSILIPRRLYLSPMFKGTAGLV